MEESALTLSRWQLALLRSTCSRHLTEKALVLDDCESRLEGHLCKPPQNFHQRMRAQCVAEPRKYESAILLPHSQSLYIYSAL